jgi:hypothetical protein
MTDGERATLVQLVAAIISRHSDAHPLALADTIISKLETVGLPGVTPAAVRAVGDLKAPFRPHVWPQNPGSVDRRLHCLNCGAAFGGQRAEGPCEGTSDDGLLSRRLQSQRSLRWKV